MIITSPQCKALDQSFQTVSICLVEDISSRTPIIPTEHFLIKNTD